MKFIKILTVIASLCVMSIGAFAQTSVSLPFIGVGGNGLGGLVPQGLSGYLQITAQSTNSYGSSSLAYVRGGFLGYAGMTYTNPYSGTVFTGATNGVLPTYVTNAAAIGDVDLWANRDGTALVGNISAQINGISAAFTNIVTFNFATINGGGVPVTTGAGLVSFSMTGNGTNDVVVQTNLLVSTTIQGARKLRLLNVASTNQGTNGQVVNVWLNGAKPAGAE